MNSKKLVPTDGASSEALGDLPHLSSNGSKVFQASLYDSLLFILTAICVVLLGLNYEPGANAPQSLKIVFFVGFFFIATGLQVPGRVLLVLGEPLFLSFDNQQIWGRTLVSFIIFPIPRQMSLSLDRVRSVTHSIEFNDGVRVRGTIEVQALDGSSWIFSDEFSDVRSEVVFEKMSKFYEDRSTLHRGSQLLFRSELPDDLRSPYSLPR